MDQTIAQALAPFIPCVTDVFVTETATGAVSCELQIDLAPGGHYGVATIDLTSADGEGRWDMNMTLDNGDNLSPRELLKLGAIALDWFDREIRVKNPEWTFTGE